MALKPEDIRAIKPSEIERANEFEKRIDDYLSDYLGDPSEPITIPIGCITPRVYAEISQRYNNAGWMVSKRDTQDGADLLLQERRSSGGYGCGEKD